ncbi:hypothetical protein YC2023_093789 [Brassica napus]
MLGKTEASAKRVFIGAGCNRVVDRSLAKRYLFLRVHHRNRFDRFCFSVMVNRNNAAVVSWESERHKTVTLRGGSCYMDGNGCESTPQIKFGRGLPHINHLP